ncbi:hypothetical protein [Marinobacterium sp. BA1]|uniref:hypothetical protein n=1 Tax=Marinobacterium sp. BA1 TaxID=3138931 RepID=UPI0032E5C46E
MRIARKILIAVFLVLIGSLPLKAHYEVDKAREQILGIVNYVESNSILRDDVDPNVAAAFFEKLKQDDWGQYMPGWMILYSVSTEQMRQEIITSAMEKLTGYDLYIFLSAINQKNRLGATVGKSCLVKLEELYTGYDYLVRIRVVLEVVFPSLGHSC